MNELEKKICEIVDWLKVEKMFKPANTETELYVRNVLRQFIKKFIQTEAKRLCKERDEKILQKVHHESTMTTIPYLFRVVNTEKLKRILIETPPTSEGERG